MKTIVRAFMAMFLCAMAAHSQVVPISGQVISQYGQPVPNAKVRVCSVTSTGTPCTPTTPIFLDYGLTIPAGDSYTADQYGNYTVYAPPLAAPNLYLVQVSPASGTTWSYVYNGPISTSTIAVGGDLSGTVSNATVTGVHATTGTINGVTIGAITPSTGNFSTLKVLGVTVPSTPAQLVAGQGFSSGSEFYGDSTTGCTGASATVVGNISRGVCQNSFAGLLMPILGGDLANDGYSGYTQTDINNNAFLHADNEGVGSPTYFGEGGINDATNANATNANYQASFKYGQLGQALFRVIPRVNKVFAQDASITTTGAWTNDTSHQYGWGIASATNGSVFNCPARVGADGNMVVWAWQQDGNAGTWTGSVDSIAMVDPVTSSSTFTATGYGGIAIAGLTYNQQYVGYIVSGLSAGTHTFHGTVTSSSGTVDFGGCAGLPAQNVNLPWDFEAGVPYQNTGGASDSTTAAFDTIVKANVTTLAALPLNVTIVDVRNTLLNDPQCGNGVEATMFANCYADYKHQNNLGYSREVNAATGYVATVTAANAFLTMGAIKDPRKGPMSVYPFAAAPVDTSHWMSVNAFNAYTPGYGINVVCAAGGLNCSGVGSLANYGLTAVMGGGSFNVINCPGYTTPTKAANCTQFITAAANGALGFFGTSGSAANGYDYFTSTAAYLGGTPAYGRAGVLLTAPVVGVATQAAATSGANHSTQMFRFSGTYFDGGGSSPTDVGIYNAVGTGTTATSTLTLGAQYNPGTFGVDFSTATQQNKYGSGLFSAIAQTAVGNGCAQWASGTLGTTGATCPTLLTGTTGTIAGTSIAGACDSASISLTGATQGHPVAVSATDGTDIGASFTLRASVTSANNVSVYICNPTSTAATPASKAYNVWTY